MAARLPLTLLLPSLLFCALGAGAAEDSPPADRPPDVDAEEIEADVSAPIEPAAEAQTEGAKTPDVESPDTFVPSEDISENIAVKFPVDI